jgi:hypothetical protein
VPPSQRPSKQRRAAENRAKRQALAARREHAQREAAAAAASQAATGAGKRSARRGLLGSLLAGPSGGRPAGGRPTASTEAPEPGDTVGRNAVLVAMALAVVGGVLFMINGIAVDEDGDPLTRDELEAREDADEPYDTEPVYSVYGITVLPLALAPAATAAFALRGRTRPRRSRTLVISMALMALLTFLIGNLAIIAAMAALGVAHFQVRKADMLRTVAAEPPDRRAARDDVIDAHVVHEGPVDADVVDADVVDEGPVDAAETGGEPRDQRND